MSIKLTQANLTLRTFELSEAELLFNLIDQNRGHLGKWFTWVEATKTVNDTLEFLNKEARKFEEHEGVNLGIWVDDALVGDISFNRIDLLHNSATVGYWLSKSAEGKGIMTKSCKLIIDYGFKTIKLHRIDITHAVNNQRSEKVIKRLRFVHEGKQRKSGLVDNIWTDHEYYGLLEDEWDT